MKVNRKKLVAELSSMSAGLDTKEGMDQGNCIAFKDGKTFTYNDEVMCCMETELLVDLEGAVPFDPLLNLLRKSKAEEVKIEQKGNGIRVISGRGKTLIRVEKEIQLELKDVEETGEWKKLPEDFAKAVSMVLPCCSKSKDDFVLSCVHLHPKWIESCDDIQMSRYDMETGFSKSTIVRAASMKNITSMQPTEFSETDSWIHFRRGEGPIMSCRRHMKKYPDLDEHVEVEGTSVALPDGIGDVLSRCELFSKEVKEGADNLLTVVLTENKIIIKGSGRVGWHKEEADVEWDAGPVRFNIPPELLMSLSKLEGACVISENSMAVVSPPFKYITCIIVPEDSGEASDD
jgi:hypothetical protein